MKLHLVSAVAIATAFGVSGATAQQRDTIQIAGSSTVLPYASVVAEEFGNTFPEYKTPVVGSGGTGGGLRQFCQGVGPNTIDIANASRAIREGEIESCKASGVNQIVEVQFGYDGIVFASRADQGKFELTPEHVYRAIAAKVPQDGQMVDNPNTSWNQIDSSLPSQDITLVIPGTNHGTREVFEEKVILPGCEAAMEHANVTMAEDAMEEACLNFRGGGRVIDIAGDYTETLARLQAQPAAVGVFGLSFYEANRDTLQVATVDGVNPTLETVASGEYPVSRPLFFYIKGEHVGVIPGLQDYAMFFLSEQMTGPGSQLVNAGLVPLSDSEREQQLANVQDLKSVTNQ